jgi:pilus assembly protein CpaB
LALALGCGLIASIGISQVMDNKGATQGYDTEDVYVAKHDINVQEEITEADVVLEAWPVDKIHVDAIRELDKIVGQRTRTKIFRGDQIHEAKLGDQRPPSIEIPPGMRAIQVKVDAVSGGAGLLRPGDRVDLQIFAKANPQIGVSETQTRTFLKDIKVFGVDQQITQPDNKDGSPVPRTVSLVVTPEQGLLVHLASQVGSINLIMRNPDDKSVATDATRDETTVTLERLFGFTGAGARSQERGSENDGPGQFAVAIGGLIDRLKASAAVEDAGPVWFTDVIEGGVMRRVEFSKNNAALPRSSTLNQGAGWAPNSLPFVNNLAPAEEPLEETDSVGVDFFGGE